MGSSTAVSATGLVKRYGTQESAVTVLNAVDISAKKGTFTVIMGPSGSGKSSLLHCIAGLDRVDEGTIRLGDIELTALSEKELSIVRRDRIGFVFQSFNLLPTLTAEQNILLPLELGGIKPDRDWFDLVVTRLGLHDRLGHRPSQLSGGQQQRVACARALLTKPEVIFADEPTGNLDTRSGAEVLSFLRESVDSLGQTVVMVTHDPIAAARADQVLFLVDGAVVADVADPTADMLIDTLKKLETA
ncbi:ABC transporter ATP-binding protein [Microbispora sp. KK1-11]|uniref:ABC transporter ATP-binding protein n=1 Tax=Microbispora sp. KK1-11 TaxID=2053005 RepID=UPI0021AE8D23|nr:ABC transporter ATP-binding protein [Microbispora sp. KK1-11]